MTLIMGYGNKLDQPLGKDGLILGQGLHAEHGYFILGLVKDALLTLSVALIVVVGLWTQGGI